MKKHLNTLFVSTQGIYLSKDGECVLVREDVLLRPKFGLRAERVAGITALFRDTFEIIHPSRRVRAVVADPSDNRGLEAGAAARTALIVSGDKHLLDPVAWDGIRIIAPAGFVKEFGGRDARP